jgi:hypothetical protein
MANEELLNDIQWSIVTLRGFDAGERVEATRIGFLLSDNLLVGSFRDPIIKDWRVYHGDDEISGPVVDSCDASDLQLREVSYESVGYGSIGVRWEPKAADISPPNVGDELVIVGEEEPLRFEFEGVCELPEWGIVLRLPQEAQIFALAFDVDGAPLVNQSGGLVGVVRSRKVDGEHLSFAIPISRLFNLIHKTLINRLPELENHEAYLETELGDSRNREAKLERELAESVSRTEALARQIAERPISYIESLKVSWLWLWRGAALSVLAFLAACLVFLTFATALSSNVTSQLGLYLLIAVGLIAVAPFAVQPWVVQMMFRKNYYGFRLLVIADNSSTPTDRLSYRDAINVCWLLTWRGAVLGLGLDLCCSWLMILAANIASIRPAEKADLAQQFVGIPAVALTAGQLLSLPLTVLVVYPLVTRVLARKHFRGFRLRLVRENENELGSTREARRVINARMGHKLRWFYSRLVSPALVVVAFIWFAGLWESPNKPDLFHGIREALNHFFRFRYWGVAAIVIYLFFSGLSEPQTPDTNKPDGLTSDV